MIILTIVIIIIITTVIMITVIMVIIMIRMIIMVIIMIIMMITITITMTTTTTTATAKTTITATATATATTTTITIKITIYNPEVSTKLPLLLMQLCNCLARNLSWFKCRRIYIRNDPMSNKSHWLTQYQCTLLVRIHYMYLTNDDPVNWCTYVSRGNK